MTTPETQLYLVVAAETELEIKALFREIDRLKAMYDHEDAQRLPGVKRALKRSIVTLLRTVDTLTDVYKVLIDFIQDERPLTWRDYA